MNGKIKPGGRLAAIISRVPLGVRVLDVGTDHGIVPVTLAQMGYSVIYASDIAEKPLSAAQRLAASHGVFELIEFILSDGVPPQLRGSVDCVIIAGMGGETIIGILERADWLFHDGVLLILQPQTKPSLLREFLFERGCSIPYAAEVPDGKRVYSVMTAVGEL